MQKVMIGIFAHPDDEAFGPAGTLLKLKNDGYDIHLILLTDGEAGTNPGGIDNLGEMRLKEWQTAASILGVSSTNALHYTDGALEKTPVNELDEVVGKIIAKTVASYDEPAELSLMSFEPHGLTGHRDHIAASQLTTRLAAQFSAHEVWYYCLDGTQAPLSDTAYYEPRAREDDYITTRVDVLEQLADKYRMIDAHSSQYADAANLKALGEERLSVECFRVEA